jgi:hypothetical protein
MTEIKKSRGVKMFYGGKKVMWVFWGFFFWYKEIKIMMEHASILFGSQ